VTFQVVSSIDSLKQADSIARRVVDTVRLPADTVISGASFFDESLHIAALLAGIVVVLVLLWLTVRFALRFGDALQNRLPVSMKSSWGGFGGGSNGWEASPALTLLALMIVFAVLTTVIANTVIQSARPAAAEQLSKAPAQAANTPADTSTKK
jgi:hypothetical protein